MIKQKGSILVLVLWVLIILSLLSITVSYRASGDIKLAKYESENIKALYLAKAGIAKMLAGLAKDKNNYDSIDEDRNKEKEFWLGGGKIIYKVYDEEARFNLNSQDLGKEHLIRLGLNDDLCQRLLDYKVTKGGKGFEFMEELFLIYGMTRDIYSKIRDRMTIYRGDNPRININTADEDVLRIALGNEFIADKIIEFREGQDARSGTGDDGIFTEDNFSVIFGNFGVTPETALRYQRLFSVKSNFFRISVGISFLEDEIRMKHFLAVLDRSGKVYYWKED